VLDENFENIPGTVPVPLESYTGVNRIVVMRPPSAGKARRGRARRRWLVSPSRGDFLSEPEPRATGMIVCRRLSPPHAISRSGSRHSTLLGG
jgi:hypothetical protein